MKRTIFIIMDNLRKIFTLLLVFILLNIIQSPRVESGVISEKINDKIDDFVNDLFSITKVNYIEAENSYEYGLEVGKYFRPHFKIIKFISIFYDNSKFVDVDVEEEIEIIKEECPNFYQEMLGFSEGAKLSIAELFTLQNFIVNYLANLWAECTTTISTGNATNKDQTFLTQNIDQNTGDGHLGYFLLRFFTIRPWVVNVKSMNYQYIFLGIPIIYEFPLLNEAGLGWGGNGLILTEEPDRLIDEGPGVASFVLERHTMMTCKNVSEVAEFWTNVKRASGTYRVWPHFWDNAITHWVDKEGGILTIEQTHNYITTVFGNSTEITNSSEGILWHANHHQYLDPYLTGSVTEDEDLHSKLRADRAKELLEENYGNISVNVAEGFTRDYKGGLDKYARDSADICRYADTADDWETVMTWVLQPKNGMIYFTRGPPDRFRHITVDAYSCFEKFNPKVKSKAVLEDETEEVTPLTVDESIGKKWRVRYKELFPRQWAYFVRDSKLIQNHTDEKLRIFFDGCETPRDFYVRIEENVYDYYIGEHGYVEPDLSNRECDIDIIVDTVLKEKSTLYSFQQAMLLLAGVKAVFSTYDEEMEMFVTNPGVGDFKMEIWRSTCFIPPIKKFRSRAKLVIDTWNGTKTFEVFNESVDKLELDPFQNNYREFNKNNDFLLYPFLPSKLNSIIVTGVILK